MRTVSACELFALFLLADSAQAAAPTFTVQIQGQLIDGLRSDARRLVKLRPGTVVTALESDDEKLRVVLETVRSAGWRSVSCARARRCASARPPSSIAS